MPKAVDYDHRQHVGYLAGRELSPENAKNWARTFAKYTSSNRPLTVLDLGSGAGRVAAALADTFERTVYGVQPSARMREAALKRTTDPCVHFMEGRAEQIP